ncbi:hypothetical protein GFB65_06150 [Enterococcus faecalis]|nr:hypothetical protein GFB65_06150 [Enterococcus faecalis]
MSEGPSTLRALALRSCFCSRRLSIFKPGTKIQSDFCSRLLLSY